MSITVNCHYLGYIKVIPFGINSPKMQLFWIIHWWMINEQRYKLQSFVRIFDVNEKQLCLTYFMRGFFLINLQLRFRNK